MTAVVEVPQLRTLPARVPPSHGAAHREDALLRARPILVPARPAEEGVEAFCLDRVDEGHRLQGVAGAVGAFLQAAVGDPVLDRRDVEAQAMTGDDLVPERDDLRQVVAGVDVQQRQRQRRGGERLECDVQQHCGVLAAAEQQRRAFELGDDLADDLDGLGLECPQRRQLAGGVRGDVRWRHRLGHAGVLSSSMRRRISARDSSIERPWVSRRNSGLVGTS